jgi:hypothetical protein
VRLLTQIGVDELSSCALRRLISLAGGAIYLPPESAGWLPAQDLSLTPQRPGRVSPGARRLRAFWDLVLPLVDPAELDDAFDLPIR